MNQLSPQLLNTLSQVLIQHLGNTDNNNVAPTPTGSGNNMAAVLSRVLQQSFSSPAPTSATPQPADDSTSTPLSRTSSGASTSTTSSLDSNNSWADEEEDDDQFYTTRKTRKPAPVQEKQDVAVVTAPVLSAIDAEHLALHPELANNLFKRQFRKKRTHDGRRILKDRKTIVLPVFKALVRPVLRHLLRENLATLQHEDANLSYQSLRHRYYRAALKVVKKRRANHVQAWRIEHGGLHLPLTYGGDSPGQPDFVKRALEAYHLECQRQTDGAPQHQAQRQPAGTTAQRQPDGAPQHRAQQRQPGTAPQRQPADDTPHRQAQRQPADATPHRQAQRQPDSSSSRRHDRVCRSLDIVDFPPDDDLVCFECNKVLSTCEAFPKDDDEEWGETSDQWWCQQCWHHHCDNMLKEIVDPEMRQSKHNELRRKRKPLTNTASRPKSKKKRTTRDSCKWCKSTTHKTKNSRLCPFNRHNNNHAAAQPPDEESQRPCGDDMDIDYEESQRPSSCGDDKDSDYNTDTEDSEVHEARIARVRETVLTQRAAAKRSCGDNTNNDYEESQRPSSCGDDTDDYNTATDDSETHEARIAQVRETVLARRAQEGKQFFTTPPRVPGEGMGGYFDPLTASHTPSGDAEPPAPTITPRFNVGDNVLAKWSANKWYLAHVFKVDTDTQYHCYFLDGETKVLPANEVRPLEEPVPTRGSYLGKTFEFEGASDLPGGFWKVRMIRHLDNSYRCCRLTGSGSQNLEDFDVGYVIRTIQSQEQRIRERGPR